MIILNGNEVQVEHFPDGTQRIKLEDRFGQKYNHITWKYEKEEELLTLIYITRHLKNMPYIKSIDLIMFYLPNARMDRIHDWDEVFTLKGFADVINWLEFDAVEVLDAHSNVSAALLNKVQVHDPKEYIDEVIEQIGRENLVLYFPDAGASKKYSGLFSGIPYCYGEKNRDWSTGKILGLEIRDNGVDLKGKKVLMIDDIISYGGSLYYSAKALKERGVDKIYAYASHTENSILDKEKGTLIKSLEDGTVEKLFTTDSLFTGKHDKITVMEV